MTAPHRPAAPPRPRAARGPARRRRAAAALLLLLGLAVAPAPAPAQDPPAAPQDSPRLEVEFDATETIPGQPLALRLTVLVPTWMPKPPDWPDFDAPDLLVRLPGRATSPTSASVGDETWSGLSRRWRITPLVPGDFTLPAPRVVVRWADPAGGAVRETTLEAPPLRFRAAIPAAARDLDPFLAASDLALTREAQGATRDLHPGDAVGVTLTARIAGAPPMLLPALAPPPDVPGFAAYPDPAVLAETDDRGVPGGTRTERLALQVEGGGGGELPAVEIRWFDLDDGQVKTASVPAIPLSALGPPPAEAGAWRRPVATALAALAGLALAWAILRRAVPPLRRRLAARRAAARRTEVWAWRRLRRAVAARDEAGLRPALDLWAARCAGDPRRALEVEAALLALGRARYGPGGDAAAAWRALARALPAARSRHSAKAAAARPAAGASAHLPPLNPVA